MKIAICDQDWPLLGYLVSIQAIFCHKFLFAVKGELLHMTFIGFPDQITYSTSEPFIIKNQTNFGKTSQIHYNHNATLISLIFGVV